MLKRYGMAYRVMLGVFRSLLRSDLFLNCTTGRGLLARSVLLFTSLPPRDVIMST